MARRSFPNAFPSLLAALAAPALYAGDVDIALKTEIVVSSLDAPTFMTFAPEDPTRLFITERPGRVRILKDGVFLVQPFLDIEALVNSDPPERAMAGLAFHPQYQANGWFYVTYTNLAGDGVLARFTVTADPDVADPSSIEVLLTIPQPAPTHNIGWVAFGPDGYLYVGAGDGGNTTQGVHAQDLEMLLGKILRLDVDAGTPYGIPPDNPFVGKAGRDEIWAYGLRNPWRCSFDRATGDLWIGDVGKNSWEELDYLPAGSPGGANFGWNCMEGNHCHDAADGCTCDDAALTDPIYEYDHGTGCSIIGGHVYHGTHLPWLQEKYIFTDLCSARLWARDPVTGDIEQLIYPLPLIYSMAEDFDGELYLMTPSDVRRVTFFDCNDNGVPDEIDIDSGTSFDCQPNGIPDECENDCNGNGIADLCDVFKGDSDDVNGNGVPDECENIGDLDGDGLVGILDFLTLLAEWGPCDDPLGCPADLDNDDVVGILDFLILLANWD